MAWATALKKSPAEADKAGSVGFGLFQREQRSLFGEILDWMLTPLLLLWPLSLALTWFVAQGIATKPFDRALEFNLQALTQFAGKASKLGSVGLLLNLLYGTGMRIQEGQQLRARLEKLAAKSNDADQFNTALALLFTALVARDPYVAFARLAALFAQAMSR